MANVRRQRVIYGIIMAFFILLSATALQAAPPSVSLEDVILLARSGISDETILVYLDYREIGFELGPDEILRLREAGVGEEIIRYLLERTGVQPAEGPVPRDYYYPSRYYATSYGVGAGYYLGLSILPSWWWYDYHYLNLYGIHLGGHHQLARHGLVGHSSFAGSGVHRSALVTRGHLGNPVVAHRAGYSSGIGHNSAAAHSTRSHRSVGHRGGGHAGTGYSSQGHSRGHSGRSGGHVARSGGHSARGGGSHGGGSHGGGGHGGGGH